MFSVDDLKAALRNRGPDSLGSKKVFLQFNDSGQNQISSFIEDDEALELGMEIEKLHILGSESKCGCLPFDNGLPSTLDFHVGVRNPAAELHFIGATLQLRGKNPIVQPLEDASGNILVYNGTL